MQNLDLWSRLAAHLAPPRMGKVRDSYRLASRRQYQPVMMPVVSDRVSIFDFRLGFEVPGKGEALNAFNIAARLYRRESLPEAQDDLVAYGPQIDGYLPRELEGDQELQRRATVVEVLEMLDVECVVRGYLTGSCFKAYAQGKPVCGHVLPAGLIEGVKLVEPIFTPTTKAKVGHDEPMDYLDVRKKYGPEPEEVSLRDHRLYSGYSFQRGVIGADDKREYGRRKLPNGKKSPLVLADEVWTPDSSRFWELALYHQYFPARLPPPMDKQRLRNWGIEMGIDKLSPKDPEDIERVRRMVAPKEVIDEYLRHIHRVFEMLWGMSIPDFQREVMGIR